MAAIDALPQVTIFERSGSPGGVWKADRNAGETNMYEALWTNGKCYLVIDSVPKLRLHSSTTFCVVETRLWCG